MVVISKPKKQENSCCSSCAGSGWSGGVDLNTDIR